MSCFTGIDFTASNISQGIKTNGGRSLHHLDPIGQNPYQKVGRVSLRLLQADKQDRPDVYPNIT